MQPSVTSSAPSDTSSFANLAEFEQVRTFDRELLALDSFFPVAKVLPGLTREENSGYYYLHGRIEPSDLEALHSYATNIGELTLGAEPDSSKSRLAPQVLARIGRLQDPKSPLFPHLHHLRIVAPSPSLHFLDLLLSSALKTLELTAIPVDDPCYSSVLSFLECATGQAHELSTLVLGPGVIRKRVLDISLRYRNLRRFELFDVGISITAKLLQDIGSLSDLETFVLRDNGKSTYTRSPAISGDGTIVDSALFSALRTLEVDGTFDLIEDLVAKVSSSNLRVLSIDITKPLERIPPVQVESLNPGDTFYFGLSSPFGDPVPASRKKKVLSSVKSAPLPPLPPLPPTPPQPPPSSSTADIRTCLKRSIQKWPNTLVSVRFKNDSTIPFWLPSDVIEDLLLRPEIKHLEITGMGIDSMDATLRRLEHSKLEMLHLPVHSTAPAISPTRLRDIAGTCPHLKSLRCRICIRDPSEIVPLSPLSHQLEVLSVSNEGQLEQHQLLGIGRYLDSVFPRLKSINPCDGNNTEQWRSVYDSVKFYQAVRMDEQRRLGLEPEGEGVNCSTL